MAQIEVTQLARPVTQEKPNRKSCSGPDISDTISKASHTREAKQEAL